MSEEFKNLTDQKKLFNDAESVQLEQMPEEIEMEYEYDYKESLEPMQRMFERSEEENRKYWVRMDAEKDVKKFVGEKEKERQKSEKERMLKEHQEVEWMYKPVEPDVLYDKYQESYGKLNKNKTLSKSQKSKRAKSFDKKQKNMQNLESELFKTEISKENALTNLVTDARKKSKRSMSRTDAENSDFADLVTDFVSYASLSGKEELKTKAKDNAYNAMAGNEVGAITLYLRDEIAETDISEFAYKTDEEFTNNLSLKITKLRALTKVEPIFNKLISEGWKANLGEGKALKIRANLKMLKIIREDYENRIRLMKNPNYVLLTENDLESKSIKSLRQINGEKGNEKLAEFCDAYANLKENKLFGKGMDPEKFKKKIQSETEKEEHTETMTFYKEISKAVKEYAKKNGYKLDNEDDLTGALYAYYGEKYGSIRGADSASEDLYNYISKDSREGTKAYKKSEDKELAKFAKCMFRVVNMYQFGRNNLMGDERDEATKMAVAKKQGKEYKAPSHTENTQNKRIVFDNIDICRGYREFEEKQVHERDLKLYHGKFEGKVWTAMFNTDKTNNVPLHTQTFQEIGKNVILKDFENLKDEKFRPDAMGAERVKNYKKFMDGGKQEDMEKAAVKDVDNLIANIVFDNVVNGDSEDYNDEIFGLTKTLMQEKYRTEMRGLGKDTEDFYKTKVSEATDVYVPLLRKLKALDTARRICRNMGDAGGQMMEGVSFNPYETEHLLGHEHAKKKATASKKAAEKDSKYKKVLLDRIDAMEQELLQKRQEFIDSDRKYVMRQQLEERATVKDNLTEFSRTIPEVNDAIKKRIVDPRVIRAFGYTFKADRNGLPITKEDYQNRDKSEAFFKDYASKDLERMRHHLDRITKELSEKEITPDMLTPEYMTEHMAELKNFCDQLTYYDELMKDEAYKEYFENEDMEFIDTHIRDLYAPLSGYLTFFAGTKGVGLNTDGKDIDMSVVRQSEENLPVVKEMLLEALEERKTGKKKQKKEEKKEE